VTARVGLLLATLAGVAAARPEPPPPTPEPPPGDPRRIVAVLDVAVTGVPADVKEQFQASLDAQVERRFWIAPRSWVHERMLASTRWTEGCVVGACLAELRAQTRAELVLLVAINGAGTSFGSVVTVVRTDTGEVVAQELERCDVCTVNEALATATLATIHLLNNVPDRLPDEKAERLAAIDAAARPLRQRVAAHRSARKSVGIALGVTGAIVAALGLALYYVDNHAGYAAAITGTGAGVATSGVVVLAF
jgi:hypothetical protein